MVIYVLYSKHFCLIVMEGITVAHTPFHNNREVAEKYHIGEPLLSQKNINITDRECLRIPRGVLIEIKKLEYPLSNESGEKSTTRNIAKQGICFSAPTQYKTGETLSINIRLKGWHRHRRGLTAILYDELSKTDTLTVIAEVIWSKKSTATNRFDIGVKFINVYEDDLIALEKYFSKILPAD